ncbi:hypothetical protein CBS101457_003858 [Exobasidium rhododendri]|nr:hypothetical protein CBS101457_003858 [Exobasidium rhododendri]
MARGRRPDNSLEPSRQLLTQRAFRQRRAAHLSELEEKVYRLEKENAALKGVEYVAADPHKGRRGHKRMKLKGNDQERHAVEGEEEDERGEDDEEDEEGGEVGDSPCEKCAILEKEKIDLMRAAADVEHLFGPLSDSMQALRRCMRIVEEQPVKLESPASRIVHDQDRTQPSPHFPPSPFATMQNLPDQYKFDHSSSSSSASSSRVVQNSNNKPTPRSEAYFMPAQMKHDRKKETKSKSSSISYDSFDRNHSITSNLEPKNGKLRNSLPYEGASPFPRSNRTVGDLQREIEYPTSSSSPGGGHRHFPTQDSADSFSRVRTPSNVQAIGPRPLLMSAVPQHLLALQQQHHHHLQQQQQQQQQQSQQDQHHSLQNHQQMQLPTSQHHLYQPFPMPQHPMSMSRQRTGSAMGAPMTAAEVGGDDSQCCLGFFECNSEGNLIIPADANP